ncbi:hypothetical protein [Micromonospora sp. 4G55]|uniref:hypothetical protein n=1 Tax=Micromonospora sp. 4G55 TaxID=2806102 RepID=UPI001A50AE3F|nr:hypothetical protein [Micromonospora sp. 4G55]MBM0258958.1 hypothetical protein [Micromonospora sp. 4G55]
MKEPDLGEVMRNLSDEAWFKLVMYVMTTLGTPAELEEFHREIWPLVEDTSDWCRDYYTRTYEGMWAYFTGGHQ